MATVWTDPTLSNAIIQKALHATQLRTAIINEVTRRGKTALTWTNAAADANGVINAVLWQEIRDKINYIRTTYNTNPAQPAFTWTYSTYAATDATLAARVTELRAKMNDLEDDCVCNCNYCTCACNYCGCNCNHSCTCNCNYCTCDCAY